MTLAPTDEVWTTGINQIGHLPNPDDVRVFATQDAARLNVADRIEELATTMLDEEVATGGIDYVDQASFDSDTDRPSFAAGAQAENVRHNADLDYSQAFAVQVDNDTHSPEVVWAQPSTVRDVFGDDRSSEEYLELADEVASARARQDVFHPGPEVGPAGVPRSAITPQTAIPPRMPVVTQ
jgi:hypothetical protein